ncbi:MAG TPA: hypothetical protein VIU12_08325 [Chryseolinea sp.]
MMRFNIILFSWLSIYSVEGQSSDSDKIDSVFNYNIVVLDMFQKDPHTDSTGASVRAVYTLEQMTGIISNGRITFFGKVGFDADDLCKWRAWYAKNKGDLLWDPKYKIVRRKVS